MFGVEIKKGSWIAYPGRARSDIFMVVGVVVATPGEHRKSYRVQVKGCTSPAGPRPGSMANNFRSPERAVVVPGLG